MLRLLGNSFIRYIVRGGPHQSFLPKSFQNMFVCAHILLCFSFFFLCDLGFLSPYSFHCGIPYIYIYIFIVVCYSRHVSRRIRHIPIKKHTFINIVYDDTRCVGFRSECSIQLARCSPHSRLDKKNSSDNDIVIRHLSRGHIMLYDYVYINIIVIKRHSIIQ